MMLMIMTKWSDRLWAIDRGDQDANNGCTRTLKVHHNNDNDDLDDDDDGDNDDLDNHQPVDQEDVNKDNDDDDDDDGEGLDRRAGVV